jgi:hypothetical protein
MSDAYQDPEEKAEELGLVVKRPGPTEVFVDLDGAGACVCFEYQLDILREFMPQTTYEITESQTDGHYHAVVDLKRPLKDAVERIAFQAALGSDRKREILALRQVFYGASHDSSVFFERPS